MNRVIRVVLQCRACGEESIDKHPVTMPDGRVAFEGTFKHKPGCAQMREAKATGVIDLSWLTIRFVREHPELT